MDAYTQINDVKRQIFEYYEMSFEKESDDYEFNQRLKNKLKDIIVQYKDDNTVIEKALMVLAETTGCAEDHEIAEAIIDYLFGVGIINKEQMDMYYNNVATGRWL